MKKLMSVIFFGLEHFEYSDQINLVYRIAAKWNLKSGEKVDSNNSPHEKLEGTIFHGGAILKNIDPEKEDSLHVGVIFQAAYQGYSWSPNCRATCFAFMDWLKTQNIKAALVMHQEDPFPETDPNDER